MITVGITTRNRQAALVRCLRSLWAIRRAIAEVLVFDDLSDVPVDATLWRSEVAPEVGRLVHVVRPRHRLGYVEGRNRIVSAARANLVLLLDDDVAVIEDAGIEQACRLILREPGVGAVAFAQANAGGEPWPPQMQPSIAQYPCYVPSFIGFAHLVRRDIFLALGGYRSSFRFYGEEKDFGLRLLDAGFDIVYLPAARVAHLPDPAGRSPQRYLRYVTRNDCLGALYNEPWWRVAGLLPLQLVRYFKMRRSWRIDDRGGLSWIAGEIVRHAPEALRVRRPVARRTRRRWRQLRRSPPPYPRGAEVADR